MRAPWTICCSAVLLLGVNSAWSRPDLPKSAIPINTSPDVKTAITAMYSPDPAARIAAVQSLSAWPYRATVAIPFLVGLLGDDAGLPGPTPAQAAADLLVKMEDLSIGPVATALSDPSPSVRQQAAEVLGRIGKPDAVKALTGALRDKHAGVRVTVMNALVSMRVKKPVMTEDPTPPDVAGLILPMLQDREAVVRAEAARMLPVTGEDRIVTALLATLADPDPQVRIAAAQALPKTADSRTIEPLLRALADPDPLVRIAVMQALIESYDRRAKEPLFALFQDQSPQVRQAVISHLGNIPSRYVMGLLMTAMKDSDADVRTSATLQLRDLLDALGKRRTALREAFTTALQDPSPAVRAAALPAIRELVPLSERMALVKPLLHDPDPAVRVAALSIIRELGPHNERKILVQPLLLDPDPYVRLDAIGIVFNSCDTGQERVELIRPLIFDSNPMVRRTALSYVGQRIPFKEATLETLLADLNHPSALTRAHAASALEEYEDTRAIEPLLAHVHDPSATVRAAVVSALRPFDDPRAVEAVKAALHDGDVRVEQSAAEGFRDAGFAGEEQPTRRGRGEGGMGGAAGGRAGWLGGD